jgi:phosphoglycolate phosphatase
VSGLRLVIFDLDGTLVDSADVIVQLMEETFSGRGLTVPSARDIRRTVGLSLEVAMVRLGSGDAEEGRMLANDFRMFAGRQHQRGMADHRLYPGAKQAIERIGTPDATLLGIATGKELAGLKRVLESHDLGPNFTTLQTPDTNPSKPHPGMVLSAMSETGAHEGATVMVGDTSFDMEAAVAAGARCIGVSWGYHSRGALKKAGAASVIDRFDQLDEAIETALGAGR